MRGEADQQETTAHEGGVEQVAAQTAKGHLADTDGYKGTDDDNPDGEVRGQVKSQQQTREDGRTIEDGVARILQKVFIDDPLEKDAGQHAGGAHDG